MFKDIREGNQYKNYIDGKWTFGENNKFVDINSPIDDSLVGKIPSLSQSEVDEAIESAKQAQKEWREVPNHEKAIYLYKVAELLDEQAETIADIMVKEIGKDRKSSVSEMKRTADIIRYTADIGKSYSEEFIDGDSFPGYTKKKMGIIKREPLGVILAISPFNYPVNLAASKIFPALMAGNTVVLKPATQGAISALHLVKIMEEAKLPKGVINTITGRGSEIGDYVVTHPRINMINFTGSTETGDRIAQISSGVPLLMELGGKDPAIVLEDANLKSTAKQIVDGAFSYSGQRCTAIKRVLVLDSIADELVSIIKDEISKLTVGNPLEEQVVVGPLVDKKSADYVDGLIKDTIEKGGKLIIGGKRDGNLIYPTLFDNVTVDMRLAWEEPFGPVLPVIRVSSVEEAIKISNESKYGLQAAVFTNNINKAMKISGKLDVGTVQINNKTERGPDNFPFLGVKSSGIGVQGIRSSIDAMSRPKVIAINVI